MDVRFNPKAYNKMQEGWRGAFKDSKKKRMTLLEIESYLNAQKDDKQITKEESR